MDHEENNKDGSTAAVVPLLGQFGRSLSNLFTRCATPGQVIVLSIDDITNGLGDEVEYLLDGNKRGGPVAMLKWAKGSKNGGHNSSTDHHSGSSAARVSLADLRRASAKLLRRKDSSSTTKSKNSPTTSSAATTTSGSPPHDIKTGATTSSDGGGSPPPPLVPPRGSSAASCHGIPSYGHSGGSVISAATTPCSVRSASHKAGVIKQATVRRMSTLRQARSVSPVKDRGQQRRPDSSSSCTTNSSCSSSITSRRTRRKPAAVVDDNGSSLYMQLDKIPVAVQQTAGSSSAAYMSAAAANLKRKALEDISNQAYRNIIHSLQDELAQMSDAEAEAEAARSASADETRTLAEATLLPMNRMEITRSSTVRPPKECDNADAVLKLQVSPCPSIKYQHQRSTSQPMPLKKLDGVVASFTNQPPASSDLHRPRPVRHPPSPTAANESGDNLMDLSSLALACSRNGLPSTPTPSSACHPFNGTSSPLKKSAPCGPHSSTGQHLHQYGPARSLVSHGLSIGTSSAVDSSRCQDSSSQNQKKSRPNKQVTFQTEARLIGNESITLPVVFESDREDGGQTDGTKEPQPLEMPGFVNIPCSRRGFCLELDSANDLPEVGKLNESCGSSSEQTTTDEVDHHAVRCVMSPDGGYDWQPSYVNLEDTEIAPVLLASSRPADDSSDFWKPRSVASGGRQQQPQQLGEPLQPVYDAPNNNNNKTIDVDNPLLLEFPGFRYAMMQLPGNNALMERRSISNGSSGSDTQDSGVAEMAQALSLSRAASASPQLAASRQSLAEDMLLPVQPFVYNTLPRTDNKRSLYYNCWSNQSQQQQQQQQQQQPMPLPSGPSSVYSTTDPHFLSALASPFFSRRMPEEKTPASSSSSSTLMANVDQQDSSWSSDHLYCNMASVDPLPSLPPRISRRCHSLLALASAKTAATTATGEAEDADYENLNMPSQPGQPVMAFKARLNVSHSRSRSLRHSGDFTSPFGWMIPPFQQSKTKEQEKRNELIEEMETKVIDEKEEIYKRASSRPISSRRQQLLHERAHRLELMLNDASVNDCSELYEPSDWSMEAMLSDTVRDMDNLSFMDGPQQPNSRNHCQHCCCTSVRRPLPPPMTQCRCQMAYSNPSPSSTSSSGSSGGSCQCRRKKKSGGATYKRESIIPVRENAATQTDLQNASAASLRLASRATAAENPLYMAYSDLTKINCDDLDRSAKNVATNATNGTQIGDDYASDSCETWNSHKALYARLQAAKQSREVTTLMETTPVKKRNNNNKGRHHHHQHNSKPLSTPSSSRIWRHDGQSVSTPQKNRRDGGRRRHHRRRGYSTVNTTANSSSKMDQTALSTRSTYSTKSSNTVRRRKSSRRPKAADVLHGKGQLQLAIYLNSGLLTIHVQSARYLKSNSGRPCNSYVKVSLIPDSPEQTFCRTTLVKNDNNPWYDQKFSFEFLSADLYKRLFISVWDRDAKKNRSDFRGCMSFSVSHVIRKDASGWYRLLNGNVGRQRHFAVKKQIDLNNSTIVPTDPDMEEDLVVVDDSDLDSRVVEEQDRIRRGPSPSPSSIGSKMTGSDTRHTPPRCPTLEMEPKGKTPYTTTVNLKRGPKGYGFSVTWTHPPRIERVEPGLAADLAGMRVADYIVFVGSHNVVKMDEEQVLQLIQSAGDTLTLEIYRKSGQKPSGGGSVTSDQLTAAELHSGSIQPRQLKSPVNQLHSGSVSMAATGRMPVLVSHHQQPSTVAAATSVGIGASGRRVVVENAGQVSWYPSMNSASNTTAQLGINISNAAPPPLKVAFNKSIGGGVLV